MMNIYIPTLGRIDSQKTWDRIPDELRSRTFLVCPSSEAKQHRERGRNVLVCEVKGICGVRQWLSDRSKNKFCMSDDDHFFFRREDIKSIKLRKATPEDVIEMFAFVENLLDTYPMAGVSMRQGNDALLGLRRGASKNYEIRPGLALNKRLCNLYGVRADILRENSIRFDLARHFTMEDSHVSLSLIAKGYSVAIATEFVWNQSGSGDKGGASAYRNYETQKESAILLEQAHRPFVTIIKKVSRAQAGNEKWKSVGPGERIDVRVDWTGATLAGRKRPSLF